MKQYTAFLYPLSSQAFPSDLTFSRVGSWHSVNQCFTISGVDAFALIICRLSFIIIIWSNLVSSILFAIVLFGCHFINPDHHPSPGIPSEVHITPSNLCSLSPNPTLQRFHMFRQSHFLQQSVLSNPLLLHLILWDLIICPSIPKALVVSLNQVVLVAIEHNKTTHYMNHTILHDYSVTAP